MAQDDVQGFARWTTSPFVRVMAVLMLLSAVVLLVQSIALINLVRTQRREAVAEGQEWIDLITLQLDLTMNVVEERTRTLADEIAQGKLSRDQLLERIREVSTSEPYLLGMTVAFAPDALEPGSGLDAPFFDQATDSFIQIEETYDYTSPDFAEEATWYQEPIQRGEPVWVSGYGMAARSPYVGYSVPVFNDVAGSNERRPIAVVNLAVVLRELNDLFNRRYVGRLGAGILIDRDDQLLAFPVFDYVREGRKLREVVSEPSNRPLIQLAERAQDDIKGVTRLADCSTRPGYQPGWVFYQPVEETGWSMVVSIFADELIESQTALRRGLIGLLLNGFTFIGLTLAVLLRVDRLRSPSLWILSTTVALLMLVTIGLIWYFSYQFGDGRRESTEEVPVVRIGDFEKLDRFLEDRTEMAMERHQREFILLPTWIFVNSIVFEDSHSLRISGVIWQYYQSGVHDDLRREIIFLNADPNAEAVFLEELYRREVEDGELIAFKFRTTLRDRFRYQAYPFDRQVFHVQIGHPEQDRDIILTPDLERYPYLQTAVGPGLLRPLDLPGWTIMGSDFSYALRTYNVEFSMDGNTSNAEIPVLQFGVHFQREFITPFISHIVPVMIVAVLLHGVVISSSFSERRRNTSGFSAFGVLETCGAFFFTIALMHIDLRRSLDLDVITYMEMIYLNAYVVLLLVVLDALVFTTSDHVAWIEYRDNIVAKLLFWPVFLGVNLAATIWTFY